MGIEPLRTFGSENPKIYLNLFFLKLLKLNFFSLFSLFDVIYHVYFSTNASTLVV